MKDPRFYFCLVLFFLTSLSAAEAKPAPDYSEGLLDRQSALAAALEVNREKYPNADEVVVDSMTRTRYEPDGRSLEWDETYLKVITEKGKRGNQTQTHHFSLPYEQVKVVLLEVIKPDGTVVSLDSERQSKVMIDPSQMDANIYDPNDKVLKVGIPGLAVGDVLRTVTRSEIIKPRVPNTWSDYQVFEYYNPIKHAVYEVEAPKELPLKSIALKDPVSGTVHFEKSRRDGRLIYRWEITDVPRMYKEPDMPALHTVVQRLLISTIPTWEDISQWYWKLSKPHLEKTTPEMEELVASLISGLSEPQEKIEAIFRWVSQEVRYLGITVEKEAPGYEPHDVNLTFDNRHGVCRDKAALLVSMLQLAGFKAYPVLIYQGPKKDEEVPQPYFNHAISAVELEDGSYVLMDATDENTKEILPAYLNDKSYLVAKPEGDELRTSPIVPAEENMMQVATEGAVDAEGRFKAVTLLDFKGINDNAYRGFLSSITPEQRRDYFESIAKRVVPGARLTEFVLQPENLMDTTTPLSVRMGLSADQLLVGEKTTKMFPLPQLNTAVGMVNFLLGKTGLRKRKYPLKTNYACGVRETLKLKVSPELGLPVSVPELSPIEDETVSWKRSLSFADGQLAAQGEFLVKVVEFSPEQYLELKKHLAKLEYNEGKMSILSSAEDASEGAEKADIKVLDHKIDYTLDSKHQGTVRHRRKLKILSYKGKKDYSELKRDYNPVWENIRLIKAQVKNGNQIKEISKEEVNIMDAKWSADAPRYPPGKTIVASFPGVEIGSIIEYEYEHTLRDQPFFSVTHVMRGFDPIVERTIRVTAPESLPLIMVHDENGISIPDQEEEQETKVQSKISKRNGRIAYTWHVQNQERLVREQRMPPLSSFVPMLRITAGQWDSFAANVEAALKSAAQEQSRTIEKAKMLTKGITLEQDKIRAIRDFVSRSIRSAGPSLHELPLSALTPADRTLADGYGNTSDRAVLLYAMLEAVGFSPEFVLANCRSLEKGIQEFQIQYPNADDFSRVLVRVPNKKYFVYLNDTNQYSELGSTRSDGCLGLFLSKQKVERIELVPEKRSLEKFEYNIKLSSSSAAEIRVKGKMYGTRFAKQNRKLSEMSPEERDRFFQKVVAGIAQSAVAKGSLHTDFEVYPGEFSFTVDVDTFAHRDGDYLYLELPNSLEGLIRLGSDKRKHPYYWKNRKRIQISTVIELPSSSSRVLLAPESKKWELPGGGGTVEIITRERESSGRWSKKKVLQIDQLVDVEPFIAAPNDYAELVHLSQRLSHQNARLVLLAD